jgi:8-oxo-dGTP pyrophosphatase MutT (NUDIX family)
MSKPREIPEPRPSATILLVRDRAEGGPLEVFMVVRHHQIDFASGALVFPGGKVNEGDSAPEIRAFCDGEQGLDDRQLAIAVSAIREAFEESGVLLARKNGEDGFISGQDLEPLDQFRAPLDKQELSLSSFLKDNDLRLACDALVPFAHWITPDFMPKRFDTHFYVAGAPADQVALHDGGEAVDSVWLNPEQALLEADEGKWTIIFPTRMNVELLGRSACTSDALEAARTRDIVTVLPKVIKKGEETYLEIPEAAGYSVTHEKMDSVV